LRPSRGVPSTLSGGERPGRLEKGADARIIQVAEATFSALFIPTWGQTLVVVLTIFGFPIALISAWAFQITPEGVISDLSSSSSTELAEGDDRSIRAANAGSVSLLVNSTQPNARYRILPKMQIILPKRCVG